MGKDGSPTGIGHATVMENGSGLRMGKDGSPTGVGHPTVMENGSHSSAAAATAKVETAVPATPQNLRNQKRPT
jgi:hypothetical protein